MIEQISLHGIICPVIVRGQKGEDRYTILSGHNRIHCARVLNLPTVPGKVEWDISDEEANTIVHISNFYQRGFLKLPHSVKARVLQDFAGDKMSQEDIINRPSKPWERKNSLIFGLA